MKIQKKKNDFNLFKSEKWKDGQNDKLKIQKIRKTNDKNCAV